jgi:uncharacterized membrane protein
LQPVIDRTNGDVAAAFEALGGSDIDPVYVVLAAFASGDDRESGDVDTSETLNVTKVIRAAPVGESFACAEDGTAVAALATGNEPFWGIEIAPSAITFIDVGANRQLTFNYTPPFRTDDGFSYDVAASDSGENRLLISFRAVRCVDSMSGAWYSFEVSGEIEGAKFDGCGRIGALHEAP